MLPEARKHLSPEHHEHLITVRRNAVRLLKLVNTLLDFSRIEAGRVQAIYESTDLSGVTAEIASVFRSAMEHAGLQFTVECLPIVEPVYIDRDKTLDEAVTELGPSARGYRTDVNVADDRKRLL